jgi:hypothetical protein
MINSERKLANSIEPGQTIRMCRLAWLYTDGKGFLFQQGKGLKSQLTILSSKDILIAQD